MAVEKCHVCGSKAIIPEVKVGDRDEAIFHPLKVEIIRKPSAILFKKVHREPLKAWICGDCGHVELFVENPTALYESWLAHEEDRLK